MIHDDLIVGELVSLRSVQEADCNENYLRWMNDYVINRYMETRWSKQTMDSILEFVKGMRASSDCIQFAIIENYSSRHIGNIKIGPINSRYQYADISYFIGEKDCYMKGYATEAIKKVCEFGFSKLGLHRIQAGLIEGNIGSEAALKRAGFSYEGNMKKQVNVDGHWADHQIYGLLNPDYEQR